MLRFFIASVILTLALLAIPYLAYTQGWIETLPSFMVEILAFLLIATLFIFYLLIKRRGPEAFTQSYLLSITLKILVYGAFIFILIFLDSPAAFANTAFFIVSYISFTALEVAFLFKRKNA